MFALVVCLFALTYASHGQTFTIATSPSALTIYPGQQNVPLTVTATSASYTGPILVSLSGLPSGITFAPITVTPGTSGKLLLNASVAAGQEGFPPTLPGPTSWTAQVNVVGAVGAVQTMSQFSLTLSISNPAFTPAPSAINLPIVTINTNGVPIVDKTTNVPGTITITSADGQTSYLPNSSDSDNTAVFHLHGNTTVEMPKLPYHVKLTTSLDLLTAMGLSCPYVSSGKGKPICDKSKSYILLANYDDKTFLRDWAASALANAIPIGDGYLDSPADSPSPSGTSELMPWAPHSLFVELFLNGVYEGNYQLIEEVKVDSHRVNINELSETDTSPSQVSGGYLMEIDEHLGSTYAFTFYTPLGLRIGLEDPDFTPDPEIPEQTSYISNYVSAAENSLFTGNWTDPVQGWRAYFDETSAINFYIVNDLMGNNDGGALYSSVYMYKDLNNPLIYMGPIWDFDVSSGNVDFSAIVNPTVPWMQTASPWYTQWFNDPGFRADTAMQWNALKNNGVFSKWLASIPKEAKTLEQSQANNFGRWPMQGIEVWPNAEAVGSYDGEVAYLTNWLELRLAYLDGTFNNKAATTTSLGVTSTTLQGGSPVNLTAQVAGGASPSGVVSFLANGVVLGTGAVSGGGAASLTTSNLQTGKVNLVAVYNGDRTNALSASTAQAVTVTAPLSPSVTSMAAPAVTAGQSTATAFTAWVIGTSGSVLPTGSISFTLDGASMGTVPLATNATSNLSTTAALKVGDTVQAIYSGDGNYGPSSSLAVTIAPDFALTVAPSSGGSANGKTAVFQLTLTPFYGFNQPIALACPGLPSGLSCSFSPSSATPNGSPASATLTVSASANQASGGALSTPIWGGAGSVILALMLWPARRRNARLLLAIVSMLVTGWLVTACGGSTMNVSYPITIAATSGGVTHTSSVNATLR